LKRKSKKSKKKEKILVVGYAGSLASIDASSERKNLKVSQILINTLKEICDIKLIFKSWTMLLITLSNFFMFSGYFIPFIYIPKVADKNSIENSSYLIVTIGACSFIIISIK
jgi:hypothetical protein